MPEATQRKNKNQKPNNYFYKQRNSSNTSLSNSAGTVYVHFFPELFKIFVHIVLLSELIERRDHGTKREMIWYYKNVSHWRHYKD